MRNLLLMLLRHIDFLCKLVALLFSELFDLLVLVLWLAESIVPGEPMSLHVRPLTNSIIVSWTPPSTTEHNVMIRGYILGYGIGVPDVYRQILDASVRYHTIKGLGWLSSAYVHFTLLRGYHTPVFISACISSPSVNNCPRHYWGQLSTEGLIYRPMWKQLYHTNELTYSPPNQLLYLP